MARRKKHNKSRGLLYTLIAVILACLGYEPLTRALHVDPDQGLPAVVEALRQRLPEPSAETTQTAPADLTADGARLHRLLQPGTQPAQLGGLGTDAGKARRTRKPDG